MSTWKEAWWLTKQELSKERLAYVLNGLYFGILPFLFIPTITMTKPDTEGWLSYYFISMNFFTLCFFAIISILFAKKNLFYWRTDSYSKRLLYLRQFPISDEVILNARIIHLFIIIIINSIFIFLPLLVTLAVFFDHSLGAVQAIGLILFWMGYGIFSSSIYIFFEMTCSGKKYLIISCVHVLILLIISFALGLIFKDSLWHLIQESTYEVGLWIPVLVFGFSIFSLILSRTMISRSLRTRDLF